MLFTIYIYINRFLPSIEPVHAIVDIFTSNFEQPYRSWKKVPKETRDVWFNEFKVGIKFLFKKYLTLYLIYEMYPFVFRNDTTGIQSTRKKFVQTSSTVVQSA